MWAAKGIRSGRVSERRTPAVIRIANTAIMMPSVRAGTPSVTVYGLSAPIFIMPYQYSTLSYAVRRNEIRMHVQSCRSAKRLGRGRICHFPEPHEQKSAARSGTSPATTRKTIHAVCSLIQKEQSSFGSTQPAICTVLPG